MSDGSEAYDDEEFENYDDDFESEGDADLETPQALAPAYKEATYDSPRINSSSHQGTAATSTSIQQPSRPGTSSAKRQLGVGHALLSPSGTVMTDAQRLDMARKLAISQLRLNLVQLQSSGVDVWYSAPAVSLFELCSMGRGQYSNISVRATQTRDDACDQDVQTEEVTGRSIACQAPEDMGCNSDEIPVASTSCTMWSSTRLPRGAGPASRATVSTGTNPPGAATSGAQLSSFLQWAAPLVLALLDDTSSTSQIAIKGGAADAPGISGGHLQLPQTDLLKGRQPVNAAFSNSTQQQLAVAYGAASSQLDAEQQLKDHSLGSKGCCMVWDLGSPSQPSAMLISEGIPTCCCWGPSRHLNIVFAGMEEGGVCAWDLQERASQHPQEEVGGQLVAARRPSYTTERAAALETASPIADLAVTAAGSSSQGAVCQLVLLTSWGAVTVYMVYDRAAAGLGLASDTDMGARLGSRISLMLTSQVTCLGKDTLQVPRSMSSAASGSSAALPTAQLAVRQTYCLEVIQSRPCLFLVGSDNARVLRGASIGIPPAPKEYLCPEGLDAHSSTPSATFVSSLHTSPFRPNLFLAGHSNGTVALHCTTWSRPLLSWQQITQGPVVTVRWSPARAAVFFILDALCNLYCFDLTMDRYAPVRSERYLLQQPGQQAAVAAVGFEVGASGAAAAGQVPFVISYADGSVHCHVFSSKLANTGPGDLHALNEIMGTLA